MSKLHELLAVCSNLEGQAKKCFGDLVGTFTGKRHHFTEVRKSFQPLGENESLQTTEQTTIQAYVHKELGWALEKIAKSMDVGHQIDIANTQAKADVVLENGDTLLKDVPATSLLQLEKRIAEIQQLIVTAPTLDPAKGFSVDKAREEGVYVAREVRKPKTKKDKKVLVKAPATEKFPAQVEVYDADIEIGTILEQEWSSMLTPALKSELLDQCEELARAVKKARARANEMDVDVAGNKIGKKITEFILQPLKQKAAA